jgi:hypothetical protein
MRRGLDMECPAAGALAGALVTELGEKSSGAPRIGGWHRTCPSQRPIAARVMHDDGD